jgi:hypothetical protein
MCSDNSSSMGAENSGLRDQVALTLEAHLEDKGAGI